MADLPPRFELIRSILADGLTGDESLDVEIVFLQFRKVLEQIAFASLSANRKAYAAARSRFASDWRAKAMLAYLEEINPGFYPQPFRIVSRAPYGGSSLMRTEPLTDGFLTKDEFIELYDYCAEVLHVRNPYSVQGGGNVRLQAQEWLSRIEKLVRLHMTHLLTGGIWVGAVPDTDGNVCTFSGEPVGKLPSN